MDNKKIWYITGASKGLGLTLVKQLLSGGHTVAATSRNLQALILAVGPVGKGEFLPLQADLSSEASIAASVKLTHDTFGKIDVVVNNAGYGIGGSIEELSTSEITDSVEVNLLATIWAIKHALPYLRAKGSGHIINISSIAGFAGAAGWSAYSASKYAVIGLSEGLAQDVKELGIRVTVVAPGAFRTAFLTEGSLVLAKNQIADYQTVRETQQRYARMNGTQAGDPEKAAAAITALTEVPEPPVLLFLGSDAYKRASVKLEQLKEGLEQWKDLTLSTDFDESPDHE